MRLSVRGVDGYRFHATTSRYDTFADHIESFGGAVGVVRPGDAGTPTTTAASLLVTTSAELDAAMAAGADTARRDRRAADREPRALAARRRPHPRPAQAVTW